MKRLLLIGLLALAPAAFGANSALTVKGFLYSIESADGNAVNLTRRAADVKELVVVPGTEDSVRDHHAQIEYDRVTDRLFVVWIRSSERSSDVMLQWLDGDTWSESIVVASAPSSVNRDDLRTALTRATATDGSRATLIHIASWVRDGEILRGIYGLVAFEGGKHASTDISNFENLADLNPNGGAYENDIDVVTAFPPLAMASLNDGVDVVFGHERGTTVTRIHITPRLEPNARLWKPVGRSNGTLPPARFAAMSTAPVQALFSRNRVVLYTNERLFRFVVFEDGAWTPARQFTLDENLTGEALLNRIRQSIEEDVAMPDAGVMQ